MSRLTEKALISNFKKMTERMPIEKITVSELCRECGIQRQTFYYHFRDIRDLVEFIYTSEMKDVLAENKTYDTWQEGMINILNAIRDDSVFINATYRSLSRDQLESFLYSHIKGLLVNVLKEIAAGGNITEEQISAIADYHKYGFAGTVLDWIKNGMKEDPKEVVDKLEIVIEGSFPDAVRRFENHNRSLHYSEEE
jgi:probable dihydroxyacetone kinase regulator